MARVVQMHTVMVHWNRNISLRTLRSFCAAAETESFRVAAERLFLTSSAVSHQIKQLESELGKQLFDRSARSLKLSQDGQALYSDLQPALGDLARVVSKHSGGKTQNVLRVSVQPFFADQILLPRLAEFVSSCPEVDISIETSDETSEKHPANADVSIRIFKTPPKSLQSDRLFPLCLIPAGSPNFYDTIRVVGGRIVSEFPLLVHSSRPKAWQKWQKSARIRLPSDSATIRIDSMSAIVSSAERGMGAALVPEQLSQSWFDKGGLVQLFDQKLAMADSYYLSYRPDEKLTKSIGLFRDWVLQTFASDR